MLLRKINNGLKLVIGYAVLLCSSCKKMVEINPPRNELVAATTYAKEETATAAALGMYQPLDYALAALNGMCVNKVNSLYSDELILTSTLPDYQQVYQNAVSATTSSWVWDNLYYAIYSANSLSEGLEKYGQNIPVNIKNYLKGEAIFVRSLCYFYLVNMYGDVPLLTSTDYQSNRLAPKTAQSAVYQQIVEDLLLAQSLLPEDYLDSRNQPTIDFRLRANKDAATAYLARVYLYLEEWDKAEAMADLLLDNSKKDVYDLSPTIASVLDKKSKEAVFQLGEAIGSIGFQYDLSIFGAPQTGGVSFCIGYLSDSVLNKFEAGDNRYADWVGSVTVGSKTYPYSRKHSNFSGFYADMRVAELYLIRAEARIQQNNISLGLGDLDSLRKRARAEASVAVPDPLPNLSKSLSRAEALLALEKEWTTEMFLEGHRWFNVRRWKGINNPAISRADELMPSILADKGSTWQHYMNVLPIPLNEIRLNGNLVQNTGYEQ